LLKLLYTLAMSFTAALPLRIPAAAVSFFALILMLTGTRVGAQCMMVPCPTPVPATNAHNACVLPNPAAFNCYEGATSATTPESFPPSWCTTIENNIWFAFTADAPTVSLTFEVLNCTVGSCLQAAILSTTDCNTFTFMGPCVSGMNPGGQYTITGAGLVPGQVYFLMVDGCAGAQCSFVINGSAPRIVNAPTRVCLPAGPSTLTSNIPGNWTLNPPNAGTFVGQFNNTNTVAVNWNTNYQGPVQVCVASPTCNNENCREIEIGRREATTVELFLCAGETVECAGNFYSSGGTFNTTFQTYQGCDSVVTCRIIPVPTYNSPLFQINKCAPGSHVVCGETYTETGGYNHVCKGYRGCDSIINFFLAVMDPKAVIKPPGILDCDQNKVITLDGSMSVTNQAAQFGGLTLYNWSGPGIVGPSNQSTVQVNQPGQYCLVVTHTRGGVYCRDTTCVTVSADYAKPQRPQLLGNPNPCGDSTELYVVRPIGSPNPTSFTWTPPPGVTITQISPDSIRIKWDTLITGPLCVTANNACGASPPACIPIVVQQPIIPPKMSGPSAVCPNGGTYLFTLDTIQVGTSYTWTVPPGATFTGANDSIRVDFTNASSGQVCVRASNACGSIAPICRSVQVAPLPTVSLSGGGEICSGDSITLTFTTSGNGPFNVVWSAGAQNDTLNGINNGHTIRLAPTANTNYGLVSATDGSTPVCQAVVGGSATAIVHPHYTINLARQICEGDSLFLQGAYRKISGIYRDSLNSVHGCDSIIVTALTVFEIDTTVINTGSCNPNQVGTFSQVLNQANGCDSVVITHVALYPTHETRLFGSSCDITKTGVFVQNLTNRFGCDSTVILTVNFSQSDTVLFFRSTCNPSEVGVFVEQYVSSLGCDSVIITTVNFQGIPITNLSGTTCDPAQAGVFTQTLTTAQGCDSTIVTTITLLPSNTTNLTATTCNPAEVGVFVQNLTNQYGCDSIVTTTVSLLPSNTTALFDTTCNPANAGVFVQNLTNQFGCDSIVTTTVTFVPLPPTNLTATTCDPAAAGVFSQTLTTAQGCDSTIITTVTLLPSDTVQLSAQSCNPANVGTFVQDLTNRFGCDSIVITTVSFFTLPITVLTATTCDSTQAGVFSQTLKTAQGCDSTVVTTVTLLPSDETYLDRTTCNPAQAGTFFEGYLNQYGCDSLVTITVTFVPLPPTNLTATTCDPAQAGVFSKTLKTAQGCDSTVITTVNLLPSNQTSLSATTCNPAQAGVFVQKLTNQFGCDSIVTTTVTLLRRDTTYLTATTCDPAQVGVTRVVLTNSVGCDSTIITTTSLSPPAFCGAEASATGGEIPCADSTGSLTIRATLGIAPFTYEVRRNGQTVRTGTIAALNTPQVVSGLPAGTYTIVVTASTGFSTTVQATLVQLLPPTISSLTSLDYGGFGVSCPDAADGAAKASASGGKPPYSFVWSTGATGLEAKNLRAGTYTVTVTDANNCTATGTITLREPAPLSMAFAVTDISCFGRRDGQITAQVSGGVPPYQYALNSGAFQASSTFTGLGSGAFIVRAIDVNGCETSETIVINSPPPLEISLGGNKTIALGDSLKLEIIVNVPLDSIQSITWGPPLDTTDCVRCFSQTVAPIVTTAYSVTITTNKGCTDADKIFVFVDRRRYIYVPNAFAPGSEGQNSLFYISAKPNTVKNIKTLQVFSRWGEAVFQLNDFQPNNPEVGWNGAFRGQPLNPGVFTWVLEVEFIDGVTEVYNGDVTIVR
jgi:hypothetical protein